MARLLVAGGVALVVGALLLTDRLLWAPGLTEDNVRRIKAGMILAEVEALLGSPAAEIIDWQAEGEPISPLRVRWQRQWREGGDSVVVQFWADGRVMAGGRRGYAPRSLKRKLGMIRALWEQEIVP
jgi:hypothetical protein